MSDTTRKIPTLDVKLTGPSTYPEWTISIQHYLRLVSAGEHRVWDVVSGIYPQPHDDETGAQQWHDANSIALLTIRKNCADEVRARIGNLNTAREAYQEFQSAYEGRTTTEFYALLDSISSFHFDDKNNTIDEHIVHFERAWNSFAGIITRADLTRDDGFGDGLQKFAKSDKAKAEFLLRSLPFTQYANTIDNIHAIGLSI